MADNTILNSGTGGDTIASDDIAGVKHQLVKVEWGPADTANQTDDATGKRLPVKVGEALPAGSAVIGGVTMAAAAQADGHSATLGATADADTALTVIGRLKKLVALIAGGLPAALVGGRLDVNVGNAPTVTANLGTIGAAATETTLATVTKEGTPETGQALGAGGASVLGWLSSIRKAITDRFPAALTGSGNLKAAIVESTATVTITGTVTANAGTGTLAVDSELTTADLDTGAGTDTRAVVGLVRAESGGGILVGSANPLPVTGPLTDTQLRATPVPVSGTVTANAGTGTFTTDPTDRAARDMGKVDVALLDQYAPEDMDSGAGTVNALPVILKASAAGSAALGTTAAPLRNDPTGTTAQPITAASLPLPTGAATETTLAGIKTGTDKIPASPAQDRTTAAAPNAARLSDGAAFYDAAKTGQLPAALAAGGGLKVEGVAGGVVVPVADGAGSLTVDAPVGTPIAARLSDGTAFLTTTSGRLSVDASAVAVPVTDNAGSLTVDGTVTDGGSGKTLKRAVVALTATGDVVGAVASKRIKVYAFEAQSRSATMTVQFRDGAAGGLLGLRWAFDAREGAMGSAVNPPAFIFATVAGNALQAVLTGTGTVDIAVSYFDDDAS